MSDTTPLLARAKTAQSLADRTIESLKKPAMPLFVKGLNEMTNWHARWLRLGLAVGTLAVSGCSDPRQDGGIFSNVGGIVEIDDEGRSGVTVELSFSEVGSVFEVAMSTVTDAIGEYSLPACQRCDDSDYPLVATVRIAPSMQPLADTWEYTESMVSIVEPSTNATVHFSGANEPATGGPAVAVPDSGAALDDAERLTGVTARLGSLVFDIPVQWTAAATDEVQLIVSGAGTDAAGVGVVLDVGVDNLGNSGSTVFDRSSFSVIASQATTGDATSDPATITAPIDVSVASGFVATVEGQDFTMTSLDVTVILRADEGAGADTYVGVLPVDLEAFQAALLP